MRDALLIVLRLVAVSALFGLPQFVLALFACWLEERSKTNRILAEARLQEAKNAATRLNPTGGKDA